MIEKLEDKSGNVYLIAYFSIRHCERIQSLAHENLMMY